MRKLGKILGFGSDFVKKSQLDMYQFMMTKEFIQMLKVHMHVLINNLVFNQFDVPQVENNKEST